MNRSRAIFLSVGDEIVSGHKQDRNAPLLVRRLHALGCEMDGIFVVPDRREAIATALSAALAQGVEIVVVGGGLGPTGDDRTREGIADALEVEVALDEKIRKKLEGRYRDRGRELPPGALKQAFFPEGAEPIANSCGSAPGFFLLKGHTRLFALPGVPREFEAMLDRFVVPEIARHFVGSSSVRQEQWQVIGVSEAEVDERASRAIGDVADVRLSFLASNRGIVEVHMAAYADSDERAEQVCRSAGRALRKEFKAQILPSSDTTLVACLADLLREREWRLAAAESCTGGLIGKRMTDLPGASDVFVGSSVTYDNTLKRAWLNIPADVIDRYGAVSAAVARAMTRAVRETSGAQVALGITGIAGPAGGSEEKPVGLVYVGVSFPGFEVVSEHFYVGDRDGIRQRAATGALEQLRRGLAGLPALPTVVEEKRE